MAVKKSLEDQAMGPMEANVEMNMDTVKLFKWLNESPGYRKLFEAAYPGEGDQCCQPVQGHGDLRAHSGHERFPV